ncbi:hypothetical protein [Pseudoalteromonas aurantia]|uniref:Orphan protein n=1 Tax=Pseudoalteromonas aurantia 208 TaxID=1314867 RepID=A0ABR9EFJ2_9GAMM|nr:hypothetical protein [Pseudoalteromonas aurantia]MBE0369684.1 hypothetical protein [Pseudoalteromonas aurantia 208]
MSKPEFDHFIERSLAQPSEIQPEKDLWPGIEHAIGKPITDQKPHNIWPKVSGVAACFIVALVTWQAVMVQPKHDAMASMTHFFDQQKQTLLVQYEQQPALVTGWQIQLQELENAELAIKQALENDPQNAALLKMLAQVYQQQLDLINKVHTPRWQQI